MREPPGASPVLRVRVPLAKPRICGTTCPSESAERHQSFSANKPRPRIVQALPVRGYSRSSTAIEYPRPLGRRGFDSHRERQFRRAVEFGLSVKSERMSGFKPRAIRQLMDSQLALCPSHQCVGRLIEGYCPPKMRRADDETLLEVSICSLRSIFDGSQDWVIAHNDVVAGSSPASGSRCRGSSVVEPVFPVRFLSVVFSAGRRSWVIEIVGWRFESAFALCAS